MIRSLFIAVGALALGGCITGDGHRVTGPDTPIELTRITPNAPSIIYYSGLIEPARMVIDDPATLASVWARVFASQLPPPPLPSVDFRNERVIVAALGGRSSGGYGIELASAGLEGGEIVVDVVSTSPGDHCAVTDVLTQPVDVVKIPLRRMGIHFAERSVVHDCSKP